MCIIAANNKMDYCDLIIFEILSYKPAIAFI